MPACVECGKTMEMGYTIIENKIYCPDCAEKHPVVVEANRLREKEERAMEIIAEGLWKLTAGDVKKFGPKDKEITKDEFVEVVKRRRLLGR